MFNKINIPFNTFLKKIVKFVSIIKKEKIMKKVLVVAAVAMLALASCKKTYTCECAGLTTGLATYEKDGKGKDAESACNDAAEKVLGIPTEVCVPK